MSHVGVIHEFRVGHQDDNKAEQLLREIFDAVAKEEIPTGDVSTFALYRDPSMPGKWCLFEYLLESAAKREPSNIGRFFMFEKMLSNGTENSSVAESVRVPAQKLAELMAERSWRTLLTPVVVHGCGGLVPGATARKPDKATDLGAVYKFKCKPEHDAAVERITRDIFKSMEKLEYPTNDVMTYTLFRDSTGPGRWIMFEHFTIEGATNHASSGAIIKSGYEQLDLMIEPYVRMVLTPVLVVGCGEPIPGSRKP